MLCYNQVQHTFSSQQHLLTSIFPNIFFLLPTILKICLNRVYIRNLPWCLSNHCHQHKRRSHLVLAMCKSAEVRFVSQSAFGQNADVGVAPKDTSADMKQPQWNVFCTLLKFLKLLLWGPFTFQSKESGQKASCFHFNQSAVRGGSPAPWGLWPRAIWLHSQWFHTESFLYKHVNTHHQIGVIKHLAFYSESSKYINRYPKYFRSRVWMCFCCANNKYFVSSGLSFSSTFLSSS